MEPLPPTTKHRRGRRTARQERALADPGPALLTVETVSTSPALDGRPVVLDIGFGSGEAVVALAEAEPDTAILAVDMHTPGIGDLLASIRERALVNVWVIAADARVVLEQIPAAHLRGVRTFFPDPWPKKRHHRRRLITDEFAGTVADRVADSGTWHIATDWPDYAEQIGQVVTAHAEWQGGVITRPSWRPHTRYERRGLAAQRQPIDLWFERNPR